MLCEMLLAHEKEPLDTHKEQDWSTAQPLQVITVYESELYDSASLQIKLITLSKRQ